MVYKLQCLCRTTNTCIHIFKWEEVWGNIKWFFSRFLRRKIVVFEVMGLLYIPREFLQQHLILQCVECDWRLCRAKKKKKRQHLYSQTKKNIFPSPGKRTSGKAKYGQNKGVCMGEGNITTQTPSFYFDFSLVKTWV